MPTPNTLATYLSKLPLIAILRGIQLHECEEIALGLYQQGFRCVEIPLNSPDALRSIGLLSQALPADCLLGAGTVLTSEQVSQVQQAGGRLIVMPHTDVALISFARQQGMVCLPGAATISEAFAALHAGADGLKLFPSESVPPSVLKAWRTVLPADSLCLPVGGVKPAGMHAYLQAGANGFGLGASLYQPGWSVQQVMHAASEFVVALA
ncbi:2-dehydro-3-deoxy-6-phosphogalactonate aldolase [Undibacterium sp. TJN19]|uniref:2-dehydro-3-deoxy-6-phosphogalactonate aldolase n=1 Tax=Undibacterium sp. TJN19 TaxID=3413055 RepID=UPI003BF2982C